MLDEQGFPTNADYIEAQGLTLVDANRALVEQSGQLEALQEFYSLLADPTTRAQALADFDAAWAEQTGEQPGMTQRPAFPGRYTENSGDDGYTAFQRARDFGMPAGQEQTARQLWGQVPARLQAQMILEDLRNL